ncbi:MAG TPA: peptidase MA family metallohydrolase [Vicinamibacteria bacterium]|nr:peptidase MA family metallohydrolase [Vicinamibacteria bacterium]
MPNLPPLTERSVSPSLLALAIKVAGDHPDSERVRAYVVQAHLLLSSAEVGSRRFSEALRYLDGAESWGAPPADIATYRAVIYGHLERWELAERWARAAIAYGSDESAEMHHLIGKAHYFREELDKAVEAFEKALAIGEDPRYRASLEAALRDARTASSFDQKRLSHFIVSYEGETMEDTGRLVLDTMERSYAALVSQLGFEPSQPVVVLLYSRRSYTEMGGPHWSAGYYDGKIRIPVQGLSSLDGPIRSTLHHELAHAFIHVRAGTNAPRWLHEGLAQYVEGASDARQGSMLAKQIRDGKTFESCLVTTRCDVRLFYPASSSIVDYLIRLRGMGGVRDLLGQLGEGDDIDSALRRITGKDQYDLIREWQHFLKRRHS